MLGATEFEYGLQEGLTSVGFVLGSFFMARFASRLVEPMWIVIGLAGMGLAGVGYAVSTNIPIAIALVMVTGFFNAPSSVARQTLLQRHTPRDMRGRVFSAFFVMRDLIFLIGMAGAGLADIIDMRALIAFASAVLFVTRRSPVTAALWLVNVMFSLAALYVMMDAHFVGVIQVLVYAGAIMVVFLFVVMLLNLGHAGGLDDKRGTGAHRTNPITPPATYK